MLTDSLKMTNTLPGQMTVTLATAAGATLGASDSKCHFQIVLGQREAPMIRRLTEPPESTSGRSLWQARPRTTTELTELQLWRAVLS